jgi:hypothetical protein
VVLTTANFVEFHKVIQFSCLTEILFDESGIKYQKPLKNPKLFLLDLHVQGFQSGPVPGTFTRLRSCIVPAEITEPPKISGGQNHKYDRLVEYLGIYITTSGSPSES